MFLSLWNWGVSIILNNNGSNVIIPCIESFRIWYEKKNFFKPGFILVICSLWIWESKLHFCNVWRKYFSRICIPMATNCAPLLSHLFIYILMRLNSYRNFKRKVGVGICWRKNVNKCVMEDDYRKLISKVQFEYS